MVWALALSSNWGRNNVTAGRAPGGACRVQVRRSIALAGHSEFCRVHIQQFVPRVLAREVYVQVCGYPAGAAMFR